MDLEKTISDKRSSPAETSLALLDFLQDFANGGSSKEQKFLRLFPHLMERIFGPTMNAVSQKEGGDFVSADLDGIEASWLMKAHPWKRAPSSNYNSTSTSTSTSTARVNPSHLMGASSNKRKPNSEADPLLQLLTSPTISTCTAMSSARSKLGPSANTNTDSNSNNKAHAQAQAQLGLFQVMEDFLSSKQLRSARFAFPFVELSPAMQRCVFSTLEQVTCLGSPAPAPAPTPVAGGEDPNAKRLLELLTYPTLDQKELCHLLRPLLQGDSSHHPHVHPHPNSPRMALGYGGTNTASSPFSSSNLGMSMGIGTSSIVGGTTTSLGGTSRNNNNTGTVGRNMNMNASPYQGRHVGHAGHAAAGRLDIHKFSPPSKSGMRQTMTMTPEQIQNQLTNARLVMTLWEYYMLLFVRHPAVFNTHQAWIKNRIKSSSSSSGFRPTSSTYAGHHGEKVYNQLCMNYIKWYFPHVYVTSTSSSSISFRPDQEGPDQDFDNDLGWTEVKQKRQEIFLRLAMEYWFDLVCTSYPTTNLALAEYRRTHGANADADAFGLDCSYHLVPLLSLKPPCHRIGRPMMESGSTSNNGPIRQSFSLPSKQAQKCIRMLVHHLVCDPEVAYTCRTPTSSKEACGVKATMEKMLSRGSDYDDNLAVDRNATGWPLPSPHTIIMPSLYNYIRMTLRHAPIYTSSSRRNFFSTLNLWLAWLEPWNVVHRKKGSSSTTDFLHSVSDRVSGSVSGKQKRPSMQSQFYSLNKEQKPTSQSKFTSAWIPYVAANLHFYTVPLAIFLRRARELDFSKLEFQKSIVHLQRVFRVFSSPPLLEALENLLNDEANDYLLSLVNQHEKILASFCPPRPNPRENRSSVWSLRMLQKDMHNVLEEIVIQHRKTLDERDIFEKFEAVLSNLFVAGTKAEEGVIRKVIDNAKMMVEFPSDYEVLSQSGRRDTRDSCLGGKKNDGDGSSARFGPDRGDVGFITERGRMQLVEGSKFCSPLDVISLGDPMYSRVKSYEIPFLVDILIYVSDMLNSKFGICERKEDTKTQSTSDEPDDKEMITKLAREGEESRNLSFRFNLRFLADCRNWIAFFVMFHLLKVAHTRTWISIGLLCCIWKVVSSL